MTVELAAADVKIKLEAAIPGCVVEAAGNIVIVKDEALLKALTFLKTSAEFDFNYLNFVTAVDYTAYFEIVYYLISIERNQGIVVKTRLTDRVKPVLPSVYGLWKGADFQEREIFDLFGITFTGHPNLKRIFLWDGFPGYPLRKDFKQ
jgi:NADH-quinone oxidoreductase subunit C